MSAPVWFLESVSQEGRLGKVGWIPQTISAATTAVDDGEDVEAAFPLNLESREFPAFTKVTGMGDIDQFVEEVIDVLIQSFETEHAVAILLERTSRSSGEISDALGLIPIAFARVLFEPFSLRFSDTYILRIGKVQSEHRLDTNQVFQAATRVAREMRLRGPRADFQAVASQSPELGCINQALNAGTTLDDLKHGTFSPPVLWDSEPRQLLVGAPISTTRASILRWFGNLARRRATRAASPRQRANVTGMSAPAMPPPRRTDAPSVSPAQQAGGGHAGWLSDLLSRASQDRDDAGGRGSPPPRDPDAGTPHSIESLDSLAVDIVHMIDHDAAADLWDRYRRGERNVFTRELYIMQGQEALEEIRRKYRSDRAFRRTVDRYIGEFERLLEEVSRDDRGQVVARTYLTSETGKVYAMLAHAARRFD